MFSLATSRWDVSGKPPEETRGLRIEYPGMNGMNAHTGAALDGLDHLRQSIRDILTTPIGTRVMRRAYGSRLYQLVDSPMNGAGLLDLFTATAEALAVWEPRIEVQDVRAEQVEPGRVLISLIGKYLPDGREVTLENIEVTR